MTGAKAVRSRMSREIHVRVCEGLRGKFPWPTRRNASRLKTGDDDITSPGIFILETEMSFSKTLLDIKRIRATYQFYT